MFSIQRLAGRFVNQRVLLTTVTGSSNVDAEIRSKMIGFEKSTSVAVTEHVPTPAPEEASFVVAAIKRMTEEYGRTLVNGDAASYKAIKNEMKQADVACMNWGRNPETWHKSVELKGFRLSAFILGAALNPELKRPSNRYVDMSDYEYYRRVDIKIFNNISRFVEEDATNRELLLPVSPEGELPTGVIARVQNNVIHRGLSVRPDGQDNMVVYAVYPQGYHAQAYGPIIY